MWNPPPTHPGGDRPAAKPGARFGFLGAYFWFVLKNVIGWILILLSLALGPMPGPGGIVVFLLGFGMIWFPGKRQLVARILRGIRFDLRNWAIQIVAVALAAVAPLAVMGWFVWRDKGRWHGIPLGALLWLGVYAALSALAWLLVQVLLGLGNWAVGIMPRIRRTVRPWLRRRGIDLLPPRRRERGGRRPARDGSRVTAAIVCIHPRHPTRLRNLWETRAPWPPRLVRP